MPVRGEDPTADRQLDETRRRRKRKRERVRERERERERGNRKGRWRKRGTEGRCAHSGILAY